MIAHYQAKGKGQPNHHRSMRIHSCARCRCTDLQSVELHISVPVSQPLDHGSNRLLCAVSSQRISIYFPAKRIDLTRLQLKPHTQIPQSRLYHRHPIWQKQAKSASGVPLYPVAISGQSVGHNVRGCIPSSRKSGSRPSPWLQQTQKLAFVMVERFERSPRPPAVVAQLLRSALGRQKQLPESSVKIVTRYNLPTASSKAFCCARNISNELF